MKKTPWWLLGLLALMFCAILPGEARAGGIGYWLNFGAGRYPGQTHNWSSYPRQHWAPYYSRYPAQGLNSYYRWSPFGVHVGSSGAIPYSYGSGRHYNYGGSCTHQHSSHGSSGYYSRYPGQAINHGVRVPSVNNGQRGVDVDDWEDHIEDLQEAQEDAAKAERKRVEKMRKAYKKLYDDD